MPNPELYRGREQTYVKHFVLKRYLERVAYNIFSFEQDFVYVDGFSGPWKSANEKYDDTSFKIALDQLRSVKQGMLERQNKTVNFRCLFIEKETKPFQELQAAVSEIEDIEINVLNGSFEDHIADVISFVRNNFSLIFIDPTGWEGFPMQKIAPLLNLRGEVMINFMSDFINRFIEDPRPEIAATIDRLFGENWQPEWNALLEKGLSREAAAIEVYTSRLKLSGNFQHVTSTRILKPTADRSYFYLIYGTQHWKGIDEFRKIEEKAVAVQENIRNEAKYNKNVDQTGQPSLFGHQIMETSVNKFEDEKAAQSKIAYEKLLATVTKHSCGIKYQELLGIVLETPLVWEKNLKDWLVQLCKENVINIPDMKRRPQRDQMIYPTTPNL